MTIHDLEPKVPVGPPSAYIPSNPSNEGTGTTLLIILLVSIIIVSFAIIVFLLRRQRRTVRLPNYSLNYDQTFLDSEKAVAKPAPIAPEPAPTF